MEYLAQISSTIDEVECSLKEYVSIAEIIVNIIVGLVAIIGGILAIMYYRKLREKKYNSSFSFLSRLKVRVHYLKTTFENYSNEIIDRYIPEKSRSVPESAKSLFIKKIIKDYSDFCEETLLFLKNTDDQFPSKTGWTKSLNLFYEFLEDGLRIEDEKYYKYSSLNENNKKEYIKKHLENMGQILEMIDDYQMKIEKKIC